MSNSCAATTRGCLASWGMCWFLSGKTRVQQRGVAFGQHPTPTNASRDSSPAHRPFVFEHESQASFSKSVMILRHGSDRPERYAAGENNGDQANQCLLRCRIQKLQCHAKFDDLWKNGISAARCRCRVQDTTLVNSGESVLVFWAKSLALAVTLYVPLGIAAVGVYLKDQVPLTATAVVPRLIPLTNTSTLAA